MIEPRPFQAIAMTLLEPVDDRLSDDEWLATVDRCVYVFELLDRNNRAATADDIDRLAHAVLELIHCKLGEAEFTAVLNALTDSMKGFCTNDRDEEDA
jgi:hypothetical protein